MITTRIIVAAHKEYDMPSDEVYLPLHVGAEGKAPLPYAADSTGDEISIRNTYYCELTGLYWAWKNIEAESIGLVHYRRYFAAHGRPLVGDELRELAMKHDIILPRRRWYLIETNHQQYAHAHGERDLLFVREAVKDLYPEYLDAYDRRMKLRWGHRFNMMVMRREVLDEYCSWLFELLFEIERRMDKTDDYEKLPRVMGYISERLLDVWIDKKGLAYAEVPWVNTEGERRLKKAAGLIGRKVRSWRRG